MKDINKTYRQLFEGYIAKIRCNYDNSTNQERLLILRCLENIVSEVKGDSVPFFAQDSFVYDVHKAVKIRKRLNLTQEELAKNLGVGTLSINQWENQKRAITNESTSKKVRSYIQFLIDHGYNSL